MVKNYIYFLLGIVVILFISSCNNLDLDFVCTDEIDCVTFAPGEPIKIGAIMDFTGGASVHSLTHFNAIKLAINDGAGNVLGYDIELIDVDSSCSAEGGSLAALRMIADPKIVGIIGTVCSGSGGAASKIMSDAGYVMISGANSGPTLTSVGGERGSDSYPGYFRTMYNGAEAGEGVANFLFEKLDLTKVASINDGDLFTKGLAGSLEFYFSELGGEVVSSLVINKGDTDFKPVLEAIKLSGAQAVFFPIFPPEAAFLISQKSEFPELDDVIFIGGPSLITDSYLSDVGGLGIGTYYVSATPVTNGIYLKYLSQYEELYSEKPQGNIFASAYDTIDLLVEKLREVSVVDSEGSLHIGRQALRVALYNTRNFEGVTGVLSCDSFGDCSKVPFSIFHFKDASKGVEGLKENIIFVYTPE